MSPDLSVIVVTHNRAELALRTLRTARAAADGLSVEWLVVDSGSTDGTPAAIAHRWGDVRVVRCENVGFAAANNRALKLARGRYVLLLNPDVEIAEGTFAGLLAALAERPKIGLASVVQRAPDGELQYSIRHFPSPWLALGEALGAHRLPLLRRWREEETRTALYAEARRADWLVGAFLIARAEALAQVGPLDRRFFLYSEEIDWCRRFHRAGWDVCHLPVMAVTHHTGGEPRADLCAQLSYAKVLFARKHYGRLRAGAIRAALMLRHGLRAGAGAARGVAERHAFAVLLGRAAPPFDRDAAGAPHRTLAA